MVLENDSLVERMNHVSNIVEKNKAENTILAQKIRVLIHENKSMTASGSYSPGTFKRSSL